MPDPHDQMQPPGPMLNASWAKNTVPIAPRRPLVVVRVRADMRKFYDTEEFQKKVADWLDGKIAALILPDEVCVEVIR